MTEEEKDKLRKEGFNGGYKAFSMGWNSLTGDSAMPLDARFHKWNEERKKALQPAPGDRFTNNRTGIDYYVAGHHGDGTPHLLRIEE